MSEPSDLLDEQGPPYQPADAEKPKRVRCPACDGRRTQHSTKSGMRELCPACDGRGTVENPNLL